MSLTPERMKVLLGDLGKATMRGVRRCPKCGTLNGTRGISCKNKECDVVFKERDKKKGHSADAVKIITGSTVQLFSVRLRDRGPDYRGFVQLPLVQDLDGNPAENVDPDVLAQAARCYVDTCTRNSTVPVHAPQSACTHIQAAINCTVEAQALTLKNSVLNSLQVSSEMRQSIWLLATGTSGPLVQRVTKEIMVVKCKANQKQLLGFLHFSFFDPSKNRMTGQSDYRFQCTCKAFKQSLKTGSNPELLNQRRCIHFYACICAFASDEQLAQEFAHYIDLDNTLSEAPHPADNMLVAAGDVINHEAITDSDLVFTVTSDDGEATFQGVSADGLDDENVEGVEIVQVVEEFVDHQPLSGPPSIKRSKTEDILIGAPGADTLAQASSALLTLQESATPDVSIPESSKAMNKKPSPAKQSSVRSILSRKEPIKEDELTISFYQWLASVTERVNQTMHYQFDGTPDPLVFHSPQIFFDCLQQRISAGSKKKRLPNSTTGFVRKDALPLGTFTKYTWHITNILHVKQIFDTPDMPMEITRSFVENRDGTYDPYEPKIDDNNSRLGGLKPLRPFELKTYLKVGNTSPDQKDPTPFIIEWIPDILPKSHIGELRIKFEYGHQRNGHVEKRPAPQIAGSHGT